MPPSAEVRGDNGSDDGDDGDGDADGDDGDDRNGRRRDRRRNRRERAEQRAAEGGVAPSPCYTEPAVARRRARQGPLAPLLRCHQR